MLCFFKEKDCGSPASIENGHIGKQLFNTTFESEVDYICSNNSYTMIGMSTIRCAENGEWSTYPICSSMQLFANHTV